MMTSDTNTDPSAETSTEFGCWKWIFIGLIALVAVGLGYLVLV